MGDKGQDTLDQFLADKLDAANEKIQRLTAERDFALKCLRQMADFMQDEQHVHDLEQASKYYEEMAIRLRKSLKEIPPNAN